MLGRIKDMVDMDKEYVVVPTKKYKLLIGLLTVLPTLCLGICWLFNRKAVYYEYMYREIAKNVT